MLLHGDEWWQRLFALNAECLNVGFLRERRVATAASSLLLLRPSWGFVRAEVEGNEVVLTWVGKKLRYSVFESECS